MNKKELVEYLEEKKEYLDIMQKDFGNSSWWYSNRKSKDCINCKVHAWVDTKKVLELLPEKEKAAMLLLDIDIEKLCNEVVWGDDYSFEYSIVGLAHSDVLYNLQEQFPEVLDITYHGRQGGWACIQYSFEIRSVEGWTLDDNFTETPLNDLKELKKQVDKAIKIIENVNIEYMKAYNELCNAIEDPQSYVYNVTEYIKDRERELLEQLDKKIELSEKLKAF